MLRAQRLSLWQYAGGSDCLTEENNLAACALNPPPFIPPPPVVVGPPPACPAGQHLTEGGQCHADHECGDDEIGGGSEECEECGEGKVPNEDRTACVACDWGESLSNPGRCICDQASVDALFRSQMGGLGPEPFEQAERYQCLVNEPVVRAPLSTKELEDKCYIKLPKNYASVLGTLAIGHSHPKFEWDEHEGLGVSNEYPVHLKPVACVGWSDWPANRR